MKKFRKALSLFLALVMCLSMVNLSALAAGREFSTKPSYSRWDQGNYQNDAGSEKAYFYVVKPENGTGDSVIMPGEKDSEYQKLWDYMGQGSVALDPAGNYTFGYTETYDASKATEPTLGPISVNGNRYTYDANGGDGTYRVVWMRFTRSNGWNDGSTTHDANTATWHVDGYVVLNKTEAVTVSYFVAGESTPRRMDNVTKGATATNYSATDLLISVGEDEEFLSWYTDEACTVEYDFNTPVEENISLYCKIVDKPEPTPEPTPTPEPQTANYTVEWYEVGNETPIKTDTRTGTVGELVSATEADQAEITKDGSTYIFDAANEGNCLSATLEENGTVLKLYFEKAPKYTVTYSWTGLPEGATATLPEGGEYEENAQVTVDTTYTNTSTVTVNGETYTFSGWDKIDFTMPGKNVTISGTWTKTAVSSTPMEIKAHYLVEWYDTNGNTIKPTETRTGKIGDTVSAADADKKIEGYTFDTTASNVLSGKLKAIEGENDIVILKLYFKKTVPSTPLEPATPTEKCVNVVYWGVMDDNTSVKLGGATETIREGDTYHVEKKVFEGWLFDHADCESVDFATSVAVDGFVTVNVYYKRGVPSTPMQPATPTVKYVNVLYWGVIDDNTSEKLGGAMETIREGDIYNVEKKAFEGWRFDHADCESVDFATSVVVDGFVTVNVYYKRVVPQPVTPSDTVRYLVEWYEVGQTAPFKTDVTRTGKIGDTVSATDADKVIEGYTFDAANAGNALNGGLKEIKGENDIVVLKLYFTKNQPVPPVVTTDPDPVYYNLTINYVYEDGTTAAETYTARLLAGTRYTRTSPIIEGYTADKEVVSGNLRGNETITVTYTAVEDLEETQPPLEETPAPTESAEPVESEELDEDLIDQSVPMAEAPVEEPAEEDEELADMETPLADVPKTGDQIWFWILMTAASAAGLYFALPRRKAEQEA